ncbi:winged helix-turn-helix domain-containing protein [Halonotius sp. GCM10025705]|uniref:winged helix-turn-helix domain-containing protein n=1 Tax=Halonotius sp. GCM10025705 TaxID=3252678 RepID=UPI00361551C8
MLEAAARDPDATNADIAEETGKRITFVRDTRNEYEDQVDVGVEPAADEDDSGATDGSDEVELSDRQQEILALAEEDPELTNAEIAEQTGARVTLVRDTRSEHADGGFEFGGEAADDSGSADSDGGSTDGNLQEQIQQVAADNPEWTYGEIAAEVGARVPLVRDTLADYDYSSGGGIETADDGELPAGVDASMLTDTEQAILELAQEDPELTNAEIAAKTGTHVAIVRDTRVEHEPGKSADYGGQGTIEEDDADDDDAGTVSASSDDDREWEPGEPSDLQTEILRLAFDDPELTNAEIAAETGARIPVVRDTRDDYADLERSDLDDDTGEETVESSIDAGPGEPTAVQESILDAAAENPDATNAEIADELDVRVTLVRDTRRTYDADDAGDSASGADTADADADSAAETAAEPEAGVSMGRLVALAVLVILIIVVVLSLN